MLRISWTAKKLNETVLREDETTKSLINRIRKHQATFFDHVKRETRTSCDNWNDRRKTQQGKTALKVVGWTNKVAKSRMSDRCAKSVEG